tara:strand:+ start:482 stop:703 length:222 start_codon:yes stop_codon:yes gene_type:complete
MELEQKNKEALTEILHMISKMATQCDRILNYPQFAKTDVGYTDSYGDLQKAIVGMIRGSEFAFEELTGVKYQD